MSVSTFVFGRKLVLHHRGVLYHTESRMAEWRGSVQTFSSCEARNRLFMNEKGKDVVEFSDESGFGISYCYVCDRLSLKKTYIRKFKVNRRSITCFRLYKLLISSLNCFVNCRIMLNSVICTWGGGAAGGRGGG
jgi:hypothetical protein